MSTITMKDTTSIDYNCIKNISDSLVYRVATTSDCDSLAALLNSSYRGELSHQGWTNENDLISGPRTNEKTLLKMINSNKYVFLIFFGEVDQILKGCVNLQCDIENKTAELGMFAVRPDLQNRGYGKFILKVAENYAINNWNTQYIELEVISQRSELISYYNRCGYIDTGIRRSFPVEQLKLGGTLRDDLEICFMSKCLKENEK